MSLITALGVDSGEAEADAQNTPNSLITTPQWEYFITPSSDGTRLFVRTDWKVGAVDIHGNDIVKKVAGRYIVVDGQSAIWTPLQSNLMVTSGVTYFTNRWGDKVSVTESGCPPGVYGAPSTIVLKNEKNTTTNHSITLTLAFTSTPFPFSGSGPGTFPCTVTVTNTLGLPTATLTASTYQATQRMTYVPPGPGAPQPSPTSIWDAGVTPTSISLSAGSGPAPNPTVFTWDTDHSGLPRPRQLVHANGLTEHLDYDWNVSRLSNDAYDPLTGYWRGYQVMELENCANTCTFPTQIVNLDDFDGVNAITLTGPGVSQKIAISRLLPTGQKYGTFAWVGKQHITSILKYANSSGTGTYRGVRIYHPSVDSWSASGNTSASAYLFAASVVVGSESLHGSSVDSNGQPTGYTVDAVTLYDGWNLQSWANPIGSLGNGLPVNPVARRTRTYTVDLPVKTLIAGVGGEDAFGPTRTDEYTDVSVSSMPTVDTTSAPIWSSGLSLPSGLPIHRTGTINRIQDRSLWMLKTNTDQKTLDGGSLPNLRYDGNALPTLSGVSSVDFGTTSFHHDSSGRVDTVTGARGSYTATESRSFLSGYPLMTQSLKTLTGPNGAILPNPADGSVQAGTAYQYDGSSFQWLTGEKDLADGRWNFFQNDDLGRVTQVTDKIQVVTTTSFDAWGRVSAVTRLAKGAAGQVKTEHFYDINGLWKEESVTGAGVTLTSRSEVDAFGRVVYEAKYQGYGPGNGGGTLLESRITTYDGWGQKVSQTPWLKVGQGTYGNFTWDYDALGRVTATHDRVGNSAQPAGRLLTQVVQQPKYMTVTGTDGVSVTGVATTVQEYWNDAQVRTYTRTEVHDLLGQKAGIIDQKGQTSLYLYDKDGHLLQTQQGGQLRTYQYNDMGWLTSRTEPEEGTTQFGVGANGFNLFGTSLVTVQKGRNGSLSNTTSTTLDSHLLPSQIVASGPEGTITRNLTYDYSTSNTHALTGLTETQAITSVGTSTLYESYGYDDLVRLSSKAVGDGSQSFTVSRVLDDLGNELSLTYPAGGGKAVQTVINTYDAQLRPATVSFGGTTRGSMAYDQISGSSDMATLTFGNAATTTTKVDNGEVVQVTHSAAAGVLESNAVVWTAGGLMLSRGSDTFDYDELQRLKSAHIQNPSTGTYVDQTFTYDRWGNRSGVTTSAPAGTLPTPSEALSWTATYDAATNSLPSSVSGAGPWTTGVQYDQLGRMTQVWAIPALSSSLTQWGYDPSGRVMTETANGVYTTFLLDAEGLRFRRTKGDGTVDYTVYGFHREPLMQFERPLGQVHSGSKAVQIFHKNGTNSSLSRYLGTFASGDTVTATVWFKAPIGEIGKLYICNVVSTGYSAYDNVASLIVNGNGQWQQITVSHTMSHADGMWVYVFGNNNGSGDNTTSTIYDDIAVSSTQRGAVTSDDFENPVIQTSSNYQTNSWYAAGEPTDIEVSGSAGALEWRKSMVYGFGQLLSEDGWLQGTFYEQGDQVGSPNLLTDASGVLINRSKNLPFGERLVLPVQSARKSVRRFTNHEDQDGPAIYMQARTYLPAYGKFAQVDPAYDQTKDDPESWNLYNYVTNNPVTHTDPDGRTVVVLTNKKTGEHEFKIVADGNLDDALSSGGSTLTAVDGTKIDLPGPSNTGQTVDKQGAAPSTAQTDNTVTTTNPGAPGAPGSPVAHDGVPANVKADISAAAKASNSPTADDKTGKFHEEGGIWGKNDKGATLSVPAKPGPLSKPGDATAQVEEGNSVNPALRDSLVTLDGKYHIHPAGVRVTGAVTTSFVQPPSPQDIANAEAGINIVVGAGNNRVYFYNNTGIIREISLRDFLREPE
ncbi:MAG TPA: RHS repeat-associated core domain-containing protein [Holophagaceae bacterium]|nr:RHS repeat-associated core domain-containing protein [Holophagaceae bacterium]